MAQDQTVNGLTKQEEKIKQYEDKVKRRNDRAAIFKKLQEQLDQFKNEMFQNSEQLTTTSTSAGHKDSSSISPKRSKDLIKGQQNNNDLVQIDVKNKDGNAFAN